MVKERGIPFIAPMVLAIQELRKTHTRRTRGLDKINENPDAWVCDGPCYGPDLRWSFFNKETQERLFLKCPYGKPGDLLWVKETWAKVEDLRSIDPGIRAEIENCFYRADYPTGVNHDDGSPLKWRPSIFMPRDRSRITLEVTGVRVERLQDISEADCLAEGIRKERNRPDFCIGTMPFNGDSSDFYFDPFLEAWTKPAQDAYFGLWDLINGYESHKANPWVWVIEFQPQKAPDEQRERDV